MYTSRPYCVLSILIILLDYSRLGGLEGFAFQTEIFLLLLFASFTGKKQQQKHYFRGPAAPAAPAGELAI
jgi:hypothetical protein